MNNYALIFAGGVGKRMTEADVPKQFLEYDEKPVIIHTLELFELHPMIDGIVVVCVAEWIERLHEMLERHGIKKVVAVVPGGDCTQKSIYNGLCELEKHVDDDAVVLIHDGVRPLINEQTISDNIDMVVEHGNCVTCAEPTETVLLYPDTNNMSVPRRDDMLIARAPQSFLLKDILACHRRAITDGRHGFIDCCEMVRFYGGTIHTVIGPAENIKITTTKDLYMLKALVNLHKNGGKL